MRGPYCAISDHDSSSATLNELTMNARRLYSNFVDLSPGSPYQRLFIPKEGFKTICCLVFMFLDIKLIFEFSELDTNSDVSYQTCVAGASDRSVHMSFRLFCPAVAKTFQHRALFSVGLNTSWCTVCCVRDK